MKKIIFFTAPWCSGCKSLKPQLHHIIEGKNIKVEEIDVDANPQEAEGYGVTSLPTLFFVQDDQLVSHKTGNSPTTIQYIRHFIE